ncbi:MAG: DUF1648 domain-containing protein [Bacilli bacterium]
MNLVQGLGFVRDGWYEQQQEVIGVWRYPHLPEVLATHFSTSGAPNGLEPKSCEPMLALSENLNFLSANIGPFLSAAILRSPIRCGKSVSIDAGASNATRAGSVQSR